MNPLHKAAIWLGSKWLMGLVATTQVLFAQTVFVSGGSGLREYNASGSLIGQIATPTDNLAGAPPQGVAYSLDGFVFGISRSSLEPIQRYTPATGSSSLLPNPLLGILVFQSTGSIAVDGAGNLVAPGNGNAPNGGGAVVMRFRSDGTFIGGTKIQGASPFPSGGGFLSSGVGIGLEGSIYVSDGPKIFRVSSDLSASSLFQSDSNLNVVYSGLAIDPLGNLYAARHAVGSPGSGEIHKYSPAGADLGTYLSGLDNPGGIAFDAAGSLYVSDTTSILKKTAAGAVSTFANVSGPNWIATDFFQPTSSTVPETSTWGSILFVAGAVLARALRRR